MKNNLLLKNNELYKVSNKIDKDTYFTFLTKKSIKKNSKQNEEEFETNQTIYSPNKEYIFVIGNKIGKNNLVSCVLSIKLENYQITEAKELPEKENFNIYLKRDIEELKKISNQMIKENPKLYEELILEK